MNLYICRKEEKEKKLYRRCKSIIYKKKGEGGREQTMKLRKFAFNATVSSSSTAILHLAYGPLFQKSSQTSVTRRTKAKSKNHCY